VKYHESNTEIATESGPRQSNSSGENKVLSISIMDGVVQEIKFTFQPSICSIARSISQRTEGRYVCTACTFICATSIQRA
jgi:hypothetical protein